MDNAVAAQPAWDATPVASRAAILEHAADLLEQRTPAFMSLCTKEAGKTIPDGVADVREAGDFLRYYAGQARTLIAPDSPPTPPGPTNPLTPAAPRRFRRIRPATLQHAADLLEQRTPAFMALCTKEAGKTIPDGVAEVREAVDFLRYYAGQARTLIAPESLPSPTGETNTLQLAGRGVFACISPWNFPLAIFIGQVAAALATGNSVLAKPAEQTTLVGFEAVKLLHEAGVPEAVLQLVPGDGVTVGAALTGDPRIAGVVFTGSNGTALAINRALAARDGAIGTLIAETGGQIGRAHV